MKYILTLTLLLIFSGCDRGNNKIIHNDVVLPELKLVGGVIEVPYQTPYIEPGFTAKDIRDGDITTYVLIDNPVDTNTLGEYTITYTIQDDAGNKVIKTRTVRVVDITSPDLTLTSPNPQQIEVHTSYLEPGYMSIDDHDGDVTGAVTVQSNVNMGIIGDYLRTYTSVDSSGNISSETRIVKVRDTTIPNLILIGPTTLMLEVGSLYSETGYSSIDNYDGNISGNVQINTNLDIHTLGTYSMNYTSTDSSGNTVVKSRTIHVVDTTPPTISLTGNNPMHVEAGTNYMEPGFTATDNYYSNLQLSSDSSNVNPLIIGDYTVSYSTIDGSNNIGTAIRNIEVRDTTPPIITITPDISSYIIELGDNFNQPNASCEDSFDITETLSASGGLTPSILGLSSRTYYCSDDSGNMSQETITLNVIDTTPPSLSLDGDNPFKLLQGDTFVEPGVTTSDLSGIPSITQSVLPLDWENTPGLYSITYTATDSSNNQSSVTREIEVISVDFDSKLANSPFSDDQGGLALESMSLGYTALWNNNGLNYTFWNIDPLAGTKFYGMSRGLIGNIIDNNNPNTNATWLIREHDGLTTESELMVFWNDMGMIRSNSTFFISGSGASADYNPQNPAINMNDDIYFIAETNEGSSTHALQKFVLNSLPSNQTTVREILIPNNETWSNLEIWKNTGLLFYYTQNNSNNIRNIRMFAGGSENLILQFGSLNPGHPTSTDQFLDLTVTGEFLFLKTLDTISGESQMRIYHLQTLVNASGANVSSALVHDFSWNESLYTSTILKGDMPSIIVHSETSDYLTVKTSPGITSPWNTMSIDLEERISEILINEVMGNGQKAALHYKTANMEFRTSILDIGAANLKEIVGNDVTNLDSDANNIFTKTHGVELFDIEYTKDGGLLLGIKETNAFLPNNIIKMTPLQIIPMMPN